MVDYPNPKEDIMGRKKDLKKLEQAKEEILKKIAAKIKVDPAKGEEFGAYHSSHTSSSKHRSTTH